jgi:hypothetical protein
MSELTIPLDFMTLKLHPTVYQLSDINVETIAEPLALFTEGDHVHGVYVVHQSDDDLCVLTFRDRYVAEIVLNDYIEEVGDNATISICPPDSMRDGQRIRFYDSATRVVDMTIDEYKTRIKK